MNQLEKAAEALEKAADEYEKVPERARKKYLVGGLYPELLRDEAKHLYDLSEMIKET